MLSLPANGLNLPKAIATVECCIEAANAIAGNALGKIIIRMREAIVAWGCEL